MKQTLLVFISVLFFASSNLFAQDLHVYCDAFTDSIYYVRNKKPVEKAMVKKGQQIILHAKNYNIYQYNIELEADNTSQTLSEGQFGKGLSGLSSDKSPFEMLLKTVGGSLPSLPFLGGGLLDDTSGFASAEEEEASNRVKKIEMELNRNLNGMQQTSVELASLEKEIKQELKAQKLMVFSVEELNRLRYDPHLEPKQIRRLSQEYAKYIFKENDPQKLTLEYVLEKADAPSGMDNLVGDYRKRVLRFERFQKKSNLLRDELVAYSFPQSNFNIFLDSTMLATETATEKLDIYQQNLENLENKVGEQNGLDPSSMAELRSSYISFMANDFTKTYRQVAKGDNLTMRLRIEPIDSARYMGARTKQLPPIPIKIYGGTRISSSIGIGFAQYFDRPKDYFLRDSIVSSSDKDAFTPVLSSFIHVFSPGSKSISWGGSFGVGIPLGGENNLQSISFFLGPSIVVGQEQNIVFSGGLMGGKVKQPIQGYQVGDKFGLDDSFFGTESKYALGYFLGVSFNIIGK